MNRKLNPFWIGWLIKWTFPLPLDFITSQALVADMSVVIKRIFRSLLKNKLRPYLLHELSLDQLKQAESGFQLEDLELNPEVTACTAAVLSLLTSSVGL